MIDELDKNPGKYEDVLLITQEWGKTRGFAKKEEIREIYDARYRFINHGKNPIEDELYYWEFKGF